LGHPLQIGEVSQKECGFPAAALPLDEGLRFPPALGVSTHENDIRARFCEACGCPKPDPCCRAGHNGHATFKIRDRIWIHGELALPMALG
jgi:hypothetical protein